MTVIRRDGKVIAQVQDPYPPEIIREMKRAGYSVREEKDEKRGLPRACGPRNDGRGGKT